MNLRDLLVFLLVCIENYGEWKLVKHKFVIDLPRLSPRACKHTHLRSTGHPQMFSQKVQFVPSTTSAIILLSLSLLTVDNLLIIKNLYVL